MRVAIIGAGISGLLCAHRLNSEHDLVVFEASNRAGGHANTVRVGTEAGVYDIDTGFIVFNDRNYPNFERLLDELGVETQASPMSFGVSDGGDFEYNGASPNGLFASRGQMLRPSFHRMIADLVRFNRDARELLASEKDPPLSEWLASKGYSRAFVDRLIVPQAAAVWSADPAHMWSFPARFLVEFFDNHGMLGFRERPRWRTITGGSRVYVEALTRPLRECLRLSTPVMEITRHSDHVVVSSRECESERFDAVVIATHSDQALALLGDPSERERELLGAIPYQSNEAVLHTDRSLLPAAPACVGELELPSRRRRGGTLHGDLPHEPLAVTAGRPRVLRNPQPHGRHRSRADHPQDPVRAPCLHARRRRGAVTPPRDQRTQSHALLRRLLGMGLPRGRRQERAPGRARDRYSANGGGGGVKASAIYEGTIRHRRFAVRHQEFSHRVALMYLDLEELDGLSQRRACR